MDANLLNSIPYLEQKHIPCKYSKLDSILGTETYTDILNYLVYIYVYVCKISCIAVFFCIAY